MRPSGRKVRPQGWSSPRAAVSTMISAFSVLRRCGCCARAGREITTNATQTRTKQRSMVDSQLTPRSSARRPDQEINNLIQQRLGHASVAATGACCTSGHLQLSSLPRGVSRIDPLRPALPHDCVRPEKHLRPLRDTDSRHATRFSWGMDIGISRRRCCGGHGRVRTRSLGDDAGANQPADANRWPLAAPSNRRVRTDAGRNRGGRRAKFKRYPIGFFHIDLAEVRTEQGKLYLLVAIDRTSKFAFVELHERVTRRVAGNFLRALIAAVPYRVHTVLTDNGTHFTEPSGNTWTPDEIKEMLARNQLFRAHAFELACAQNAVAHRLTKPRHPWTNGQVERMNRTIKEATVQRFYYATHDQLRMLLADFVAAYNFARRLKTLKGLTPYEFICKRWTREPERFRLDPLHQMPGLNS